MVKGDQHRRQAIRSVRMDLALELAVILLARGFDHSPSAPVLRMSMWDAVKRSRIDAKRPVGTPPTYETWVDVEALLTLVKLVMTRQAPLGPGLLGKWGYRFPHDLM